MYVNLSLTFCMKPSEEEYACSYLLVFNILFASNISILLSSVKLTEKNNKCINDMNYVFILFCFKLDSFLSISLKHIRIQDTLNQL